MELRQYQIEIKRKVYDAFKEHQKVMLQLPTGGGKTISFVDIARDIVTKGKRVMILVHRKELIDQTIHKLMKYGLEYSVIQSDYIYKHYCMVQVASVQTLVRRLDNVLPPDVIICDEAHHCTAETYRKIIANYPEAKLLGVTATPIRTNGEGFQEIFDIMVCGPTVKELIELGFLVKPKIYANPLRFDLSKVKLTAGDYNEKALYNAFEEQFTYGNLIKTWNEKAKDLKTIIFAINIEHSKHIVNTYLEAGIKAEHVDGGTQRNERTGILRRLAEGSTKVVSNVGIITEGFDCPSVEAIQLVRPTKSLSLYLQMIGRGLRPSAGKECAIVLDHSDSVFEHGFPEQDRIWKLQGIMKQEKTTKIIIRDKKTGIEYEPRELPAHVDDIELIEIECDAVRLDEMQHLIQIARKRGYKIGYAWFKFIEKYQVPTKHEIQKFQQVAGYNPQWCRHQYQQFGISA